MIRITATLFIFISIFASPVFAEVNPDLRKQAAASIDHAITYLRSTQNEDGSWSPTPGPAITAMIVAAMLDQDNIAPDDPAITRAVAYILSKVKEDGSIHDGILANYNTAICLTALARLDGNKSVRQTITAAQDYLRSQQWSGQVTDDGTVVDEAHPFYGGAGYGKHGRPDMSNTQIMIEGLYQSGLNCEDPAFTRAMIFITKCQGTPANKHFADKIAPDGGAIYATSKNKDNVGILESKAGSFIAEDGSSRLKTYGSMTYAMFKSYIYARLDRNDTRVTDAYKWVRNNYTVTHNPGMPEQRKMQGYFYYLVAFSRALDAWGEPVITAADNTPHNWAEDLVTQLISLQNDEGWWANESDRWYEADKNLATAYALTAINHALR